MIDASLNSTPLEWVRAFEAAGRTGSFTAAAADLNVTQAAVSQRIGQLEARIGRPLFIRGARGITLTVDGEAWLPHVTEVFQNLQDSYAEIFGAARKRLTISASASVIELWLSQRLALWPTGNRPEIIFSTRILQSSPQHRDANVRVEYGAGDWPDLRKAALYKERLGPVAAPSLIAKGANWETFPRINVSGPRAGWHEWCTKFDAPLIPLPKLRFDSFSAAVSAAAAGEGVLLASLPLCDHLLKSGALKRLSDQTLEPPETYWMFADKRDVTKSEWATLVKAFTDTV